MKRTFVLSVAALCAVLLGAAAPGRAAERGVALVAMERPVVPAGANAAILMELRATSLAAEVGGRSEVYAAASRASGVVLMTVTSDAEDSESLAKRLAKRPGVVSAVPARPLAASAVTPNDHLYPSQYGPKLIRADELWERTTGARNVYAVVMDSGVDGRHPDLADNMAPDSMHRSFVGAGIVSGDAASSDLPPALTDSVGHGTHVAGIVAACGNNGIGVAGTAWNAQLLSYAVMGQSGGTTANVMRALNEVLNMLEADPEMRLAAINLSVVFFAPQSPKQAITQKDPMWLMLKALSDTNRTLIVVSASNEGLELGRPAPRSDAKAGYKTGDFAYPASYAKIDNLIVVGAVDGDKRAAPFSNYSPRFVTFAAPGVKIVSTLSRQVTDMFGKSPEYGSMDGTSMAAPFVTGGAVLLKSLFPSATASDLKAALWRGADPEAPVATASGNELGRKLGSRGAIDLIRAAAVLTETPHPSPIPAPEPYDYTDDGEQYTEYDLDRYGRDIVGEPFDRGHDKPGAWTVSWYRPVDPVLTSGIRASASSEDLRGIVVETMLLPTAHQVNDMKAFVRDGTVSADANVYLALVRTETDAQTGAPSYRYRLRIMLPDVTPENLRNGKYRIAAVSWRREGWKGGIRLTFTRPGVELEKMRGYGDMFRRRPEYDNDLVGGGCSAGWTGAAGLLICALTVVRARRRK